MLTPELSLEHQRQFRRKQFLSVDVGRTVSIESVLRGNDCWSGQLLWLA